MYGPIHVHLWWQVCTLYSVQDMAVPLHGSIAPVKLEVPAAGAYRQVHCPLSTSLCTVVYHSALYCIKSSSHNRRIGPNLLISASRKKAYRTQQVGFRYKDQRNSYMATSPLLFQVILQIDIKKKMNTVTTGVTTQICFFRVFCVIFFYQNFFKIMTIYC